MSSSKRHFTVVMNSNEHGLYVSSTPSSAARKAVSKLCADNKNKKVEFSIRETTQGSNKKVYGPYLGYMQKLEKPVELEGRVIRYKPIVKLKKSLKKNNQIGGSLKVGDHVRSLNKLMIENLRQKNKENRYIVLKVFPPKFGTILIRHIQDEQEICLSVDKVAKIDSSGTSAAAAASAAAAISNQESKIWEDLSRHVSQTDDDDDDWFIIRNPAERDYIMVKKSGNSYVKINNPESSNDNFEHISANKIDSSNSEWLEVSNPNHKAQNLNNTRTFVVNIGKTFGGNELYECPICNASIVKQIYNQSKIFPHKEGCINIGKIPIKSSEPD
jgi:hypothetical protein